MKFEMPIHRQVNPIDVGIITFLICASLVAVLRVGLAPTNPAAGVAVIYSPWTSARETLVQAVSAGARFVRFGAFPFIAVVIPERPDYVERAARGSAWLVVNPEALAGCFGATPSNTAETND
jgi:hypothetical protein